MPMELLFNVGRLSNRSLLSIGTPMELLFNIERLSNRSLLSIGKPMELLFNAGRLSNGSEDVPDCLVLSPTETTRSKSKDL